MMPKLGPQVGFYHWQSASMSVVSKAASCRPVLSCGGGGRGQSSWPHQYDSKQQQPYADNLVRAIVKTIKCCEISICAFTEIETNRTRIELQLVHLGSVCACESGAARPQPPRHPTYSVLAACRWLQLLPEMVSMKM